MNIQMSTFNFENIALTSELKIKDYQNNQTFHSYDYIRLIRELLT